MPVEAALSSHWGQGAYHEFYQEKKSLCDILYFDETENEPQMHVSGFQNRTANMAVLTHTEPFSPAAMPASLIAAPTPTANSHMTFGSEWKRQEILEKGKHETGLILARAIFTFAPR